MRLLHVHPGGHGYGWRAPRWPDHKFSLYVSHIDAAAFSTKVDLRPECPPIYDQGQEGSCTGNAWAGLGQFLTMKLGLPNFVPSRQAIYWWERELEGDTVDDTGASLTDGARVTSTKGCPHEDLWPYDISKMAVQPSAAVVVDGLKHLVAQPQQVHQDLNSMKAVLVNGYPIAIGFTVFESFESPAVASTGVVPMPGRHEAVLGGHAVLVVGYDDSSARFIVRNSWGARWGMSGYFTIPYAFLVNPRLATDFWTASEIR